MKTLSQGIILKLGSISKVNGYIMLAFIKSWKDPNHPSTTQHMYIAN